jgi:hypothetical protein
MLFHNKLLAPCLQMASVPQSFEEEVKWFLKAAHQGHEGANQELEKLKLRQKRPSSAGSSAHLPSNGCAYCGTSTANRRCGRCKKLSYCAKECQVAHRKSGHRAACMS